jgi:hypothetical protein
MHSVPQTHFWHGLPFIGLAAEAAPIVTLGSTNQRLALDCSRDIALSILAKFHTEAASFFRMDRVWRRSILEARCEIEKPRVFPGGIISKEARS